MPMVGFWGLNYPSTYLIKRVLFPTAERPIMIVLQFFSPCSSNSLIPPDFIITGFKIELLIINSQRPHLTYLSIHVLLIYLFIYIMIRNITPDTEVLRIVLFGLPFSGVEDVAMVLKEVYGCDILRANLSEKPEKMTVLKFVRDICFKHFQEVPKAVLIVSHYDSEAFRELKKRNYVNFVLVDSPFRTRYHYYLKEKGLKQNFQTAEEFMKVDQEFQNQQFEACLEQMRVRVWHKGCIESLKEEVRKKEKEIIRYFRPTWDQYFMKMADIARRRSNCMKTSVGAVIVNSNNRVISTGFNGTPKGLQSCYRMGCQRCNSNEGKQLDQCLCLHAEQSALIEVGIGKTQGCRLYTTYFPCFSCAKIIKQAGIKKIYYIDQYQKQDSGKGFISEYFNPEDVVKIPVDNLYY